MSRFWFLACFDGSLLKNGQQKLETVLNIWTAVCGLQRNVCVQVKLSSGAFDMEKNSLIKPWDSQQNTLQQISYMLITIYFNLNHSRRIIWCVHLSCFCTISTYTILYIVLQSKPTLKIFWCQPFTYHLHIIILDIFIYLNPKVSGRKFSLEKTCIQRGVNGKVFYLLLYSIALRTLSLSPLNMTESTHLPPDIHWWQGGLL